MSEQTEDEAYQELQRRLHGCGLSVMEQMLSLMHELAQRQELQLKRIEVLEKKAGLTVSP